VASSGKSSTGSLLAAKLASHSAAVFAYMSPCLIVLYFLPGFKHHGFL